ncbi:hypothetical protein SAMN05216249_10370 [Acetitomaculum ruminis DSM 5522]|uniref:DUF4878 domain-containing protein n=1 Tax=Acetitomaculum ruminis DSM 5522 TaxID=1120918 RepID=A0A1I0W4D2_9FIRM|nr:hypothetical protein [Acetitomaculum ruminis]SFA83502.1 hypothetical protein SAMN05216249_10370 [Acetitomaculum ruminis DSM 5522]
MKLLRRIVAVAAVILTTLVLFVYFDNYNNLGKEDSSDEKLLGKDIEKEKIEKYTEGFMECVSKFDIELLVANLDEVSDYDFEELSRIEKMKEYFENQCSKMTYEIKSLDVNTKTVVLEVKYIDMTDFVASLLVNQMTYTIKPDSQAEEIIKAENKLVEESVKDTKDSYDEKEITLELISTEKLYIVKSTKEIRDMITCDYLKAIDSLNMKPVIMTQ